LDLISPYPFRLGTTSYIIPDDLAPNARFLAGRLRDMELVLFELEGGPSNFPNIQQVEDLRAAAVGKDLSYTVHLPLDIRLNADGSDHHLSMLTARRVIEMTAPLAPWAYVLHLDGKEFQSESGQPGPGLRRWQEHTARALERLAYWVGGPERLAVENLEGYPPNFVEPVLEKFPAARCVDVGHLWRDGHDPILSLERAAARTRVIHWHGLDASGRDHHSLAHMDPERIDRVLSWLLEKRYSGVVTLEVFGQEDLESSLRALEESRLRITSRQGGVFSG
jgi:sugar phosphate isomerase/epimerase